MVLMISREVMKASDYDQNEATEPEFIEKLGIT
jgi:hypothetical protein